MKSAAEKLTTTRLLGWVSQYALRRWQPLLVLLATMLCRVALDVVKPWPMAFLIDYALQGKPMRPWLRALADALPGADSQGGLIAWSVARTRRRIS